MKKLLTAYITAAATLGCLIFGTYLVTERPWVSPEPAAPTQTQSAVNDYVLRKIAPRGPVALSAGWVTHLPWAEGPGTTGDYHIYFDHAVDWDGTFWGMSPDSTETVRIFPPAGCDSDSTIFAIRGMLITTRHRPLWATTRNGEALIYMGVTP